MKDVTITACKFDTAIVPYIYGELAEAERAAFESHLLDCAACTDEFAAVSHARYEVYDWKKLEFDSLPTPLIEIPYHEPSYTATLGEKLRAAFAQSWAAPGIAFAGLAIVSVFAAIYFSSGDQDRQLAGKIENSNDVVIEAPAPPVTVDREQGTPSVTPVASRDKVVDESRSRTRVVRPAVTNRRTAAPQRAGEKQASRRVEPTAVPRLSGFPEDEDKSLRLAEVFDDIDTRE